MRTSLHLKSDTADARADAVIRGQLALADLRVEVIDLRMPEPDYGALLDKIFAADAVAVW